VARINTVQLVSLAGLGHRAFQVQQDPAVQKAWGIAGADVSRATKSIAAAIVETRHAWRRANSGAPAPMLA
jgi:hypothetical protein